MLVLGLHKYNNKSQALANATNQASWQSCSVTSFSLVGPGFNPRQGGLLSIGENKVRSGHNGTPLGIRGWCSYAAAQIGH